MTSPSKTSSSRPPATTPEKKKKTPTEDAIRAKAYERYVRRGGEPGREEEDWREAERELTEER